MKSTNIYFNVLGRPVPKARPRSSSRSRKHYTPDKTVEYERQVKLTALSASKRFGFKKTARPIRMRLEIIMPIPSGWTKWKAQAARDGIVCHTAKPDSDNIAKSIRDACEGVIYANDSQICAEVILKRYARKGEREMVSVEFEVMQGMPTNIGSKKEFYALELQIESEVNA